MCKHSMLEKMAIHSNIVSQNWVNTKKTHFSLWDFESQMWEVGAVGEKANKDAKPRGEEGEGCADNKTTLSSLSWIFLSWISGPHHCLSWPPSPWFSQEKTGLSQKECLRKHQVSLSIAALKLWLTSLECYSLLWALGTPLPNSINMAWALPLKITWIHCLGVQAPRLDAIFLGAHLGHFCLSSLLPAYP